MANKQWRTPPAMQIDAAKNYRLTIETTKGTIVLELYPQHAPKTVNNFVFPSKEGFYDGVVFHRVEAATEKLKTTTETLGQLAERLEYRPSDLIFGKPPKPRWNEK